MIVAHIDVCYDVSITIITTVLGRCRLTPAGYARLFQIRRSLNWLYNQVLEQRKTASEENRTSIGLFGQYKELTGLRARNVRGLGEIAVGPARGMLKRLDEAFQSFLRRVKAGQTPGYPRFRSLSRCVTLDVTQVGPTMIRDCGSHHAMRIKGFPAIRCYPSRPLPDGHRLRNLRLTLRGRRWEASMVYEVEKEPLEPSVKAVGIDLGVRKRMMLSDGKRYRRTSRDWKRRRRLQRGIARCRQGSKTRRKWIAALGRFQRREHVRERNACHRATTAIIGGNGLVAVERLKVMNMTRSAKGTKEKPGTNVGAKAGLNREVLSQNWSLLRSQLKYKAEWAGREYVEVDPKHTSQDCSRCHARNHPGRSETYRCKACGLVEDRDVNAAMNIVAAGVRAAGASTWAVGPCVAPESCRSAKPSI